MPSVYDIPNYYLQNYVYLHFVPLLLNRVGNSLACVAVLFVVIVYRWLSVRGLIYEYICKIYYF